MTELDAIVAEPRRECVGCADISIAFGQGQMDLAFETSRLHRVNEAIEAQKRFIRTVPDPDNRERAEANLISLVLKRDEYIDAQEAFLSRVLVK